MISLLASLHLCLSTLSLAAVHAERLPAGVSEVDNNRAVEQPHDFPCATVGWRCQELSGRVPAVIEASDEFGSLWLAADAGRSRSRVPGRRGRWQDGEEELRPGAIAANPARLLFRSRWLWFVCAVALLIAGRPAAAQESAGPAVAPLSQSAQAADPPPHQLPSRATPPLLPGAMTAEYAADVPRVQLASRRQRGGDPLYGESANGNEGYGEQPFPRRPFLGSPNVVVTDPAEYPRPAVLEDNDPSSFWYSLRPNIFNIPVEPEWDFYNIINTDRPDFTDAVYSVGKGVSILENGYTFHKTNTFDQHISTRQLPESLLRYGVTNELELRLKWPGYLMTTIRDPRTGAQLNRYGSEDIDVGFKYEMWQQQGWLPMTTLVAGMTLPTGAPGTSANFVQPHFNFVAGWGFRRWLYLKWQTGCDFIHASNTQIVTPLAGASTPTFVSVNAAQNSWHESISLLTQWTKRVGAFHEWFMISGTGGGDRRAQHFLDMGLYLYATPNIQFDVRVGRRISNRVDDFFTGAGFSGRW